MTRFIACGELTSTIGGSFKVPSFLLVKNGVIYDDLMLTKDFIKNGRLNFPVKFEKVVGFFDCTDMNLISLEGCPEEIEGSFWCSYNKLTSLEGCPKKVGEDFYIRVNPRKFTEEEVRAVCDVKGKVFL